ncbi:MAG: DUF3570 domain-containing protein [Paraglaciecola polaris]|uniref:DUF3570 domain-containing protein n=1 Tax=Paraglaciecola polaris TaxID=222814 RepID=UPI00300354B6|tara:strand:+ start:1381 stop:2679 length:1299 start_codon:yes stop_codon:yes gene_type:complete
MQLNNTKNISISLAAAACALLNTPVQAEDESQADDWKFDTAILYYGETDRVQLAEGVLNAKKDFGEQHIFNGKIAVDTLTGASASGAVAQPSAQTFTRPSGNGQYAISPGETPLDDTFKDTRVQLSAQWTQPLWENVTGSTGGNLSKEYDYFSLGVNGSLAWDFNQKNTTVSGGLAYQFDSIDPVGEAPVGLSSMVINSGQFSDDSAFEQAFNATRTTDDKDKSTVDLLLGVTQVISRRMLMQFNYSYSVADGYLTDPYKLLSVVNSEGMTQDILHENRPDKRTKQSFYWQTKYASDYGIADLSYRYATDDWDIDSHTLDSRFRVKLSGNSYLQPHFRYYQQSAADFYQPFLIEGSLLPSVASADYRLGEMTAFTVGLKYGQILDDGREWAVRVEYYQQSPKNSAFNEPGALQDLDLYPSVDAVIAQVSYSF